MAFFILVKRLWVRHYPTQVELLVSLCNVILWLKIINNNNNWFLLLGAVDYNQNDFVEFAFGINATEKPLNLTLVLECSNFQSLIKI